MAVYYSELRKIQDEALRVEPTRVGLSILAAPFLVLGAFLRLLWMLPAFCWAAAVHGWTKSDDALKAHRAKARQQL